MMPDLEKEGPVVSTSSTKVPRQAKKTSEETERFQEQSRKGLRQSQLGLTLPTRVHDSQIRAFSHRLCIQYGQNLHLIHIQGEGKDETEFSTQMMDDIRHFESIIDVKFGKFDKELKKLRSNINDLRRNDRIFTEFFKVTDARLESVFNTCDRIERKFQETNNELDNFSFNKINDQPINLKGNFVYIFQDTNLFETHF
ncbi:hypothetical protein O181_001794 [Austropuccinia psidii MF-1]|uniref:Uncharacterized protein n=1 Tax=Austropuccinia psidii MF-1 TaxID=1389203 RepID=A0A9Q3BB93_9BASI|nr:hypothetical protein [Austropuccinia psidii MF-1]